MKNKIIKRIVIYIFCGIIYGFFNYISGKINLPGCSFIELRPQVALPMFIGFLYGPLAGFVVGTLGDRLGYTFQGLSMFHAWNWSIGNGFIGMIPGFINYRKTKYIKTLLDFQFMAILIILASSLPIFFASFIDTLLLNISYSKSLYTLTCRFFLCK